MGQIYRRIGINGYACICFFGISFLLIQCAFLFSLMKVRQNSPVTSPLSSQTGFKRIIIDHLFALSQETGFPIFLLSPDLKDFIRKTSDRSCDSNKNVIQLGTLAQLASKKDYLFLNNVMSSLKPKQIVKLSLEHPTLRELKLRLTTHYLINFIIKSKQQISSAEESCQAESLIIHIVVLHERSSSNSFWWQGLATPPVDGLDLFEQINALNLPFWSQSSAIDKAEIVPTLVDNLSVLAPKHDLVVRKPFIECNRTREQEFYRTFGPRDQSPNAELLRIKVRQVLRRAGSLLASLNVPWWLSSGTCLGYYRQCDVIPHTTDIDIGVEVVHFNPQIVDLFSINDLPLTHRFGRINDSFELSFHDVRNDIKLDVFFFYRENNTLWNGGTSARTGQKYKYVFPEFTMCWTEFLDLLVRIPCPTLPYIEANYGQDWQVPKVRWDWKASPSNVKENGVWPVEQWHEVIQLHPLPLQQ